MPLGSRARPSVITRKHYLYLDLGKHDAGKFLATDLHCLLPATSLLSTHQVTHPWENMKRAGGVFGKNSSEACPQCSGRGNREIEPRPPSLRNFPALYKRFKITICDSSKSSSNGSRINIYIWIRVFGLVT